MDNVQKIIEDYKIPVVKIDIDKNYWLIRTQSGEFHEEFYFDNFVAIGWNEFNEAKDFMNPSNQEYLKKQIANTYPESKQPGLIYNQIKRFFTELKVNDIVMIPSKNSTHISFGKIISGPYIQEVTDSNVDNGSCPFNKRMDVEWLKTVKRSELDPYLYKMMHSHHTINDANDYSNFIDRTLHSFYVKGNTAHLVLKINKKSDLNGLDFFEFGSDIIRLSEELKEIDFITDTTDIRKAVKVKSNVQSPGMVELISNLPQIILGIGIVLTFLVGGTINAKFTKEEKSVTAESQGLLGLFYKYKSKKGDDELEKLKMQYAQSMSRVDADLPKELKEINIKDQDQ